MASFIVAKRAAKELGVKIERGDTKGDIVQRISTLGEQKDVKPFIGVQLHADKMSQSATVNALKTEVPAISHFQLFTHGPGNIKPINIDPNLTKILKRFNMTVNVHGSYLCVPWKNSKFLFKHTMDNFRAAHKISAQSVVLHIPYLPINDWLPDIVKLANQIKEEKLSPLIMLEQSATISHETNSYESPPKLNRLWRAIKKAGIQKYVGLCIDTAHTHSSGVNIRTYNNAKQYLDMLDASCIQLLHLNGNSIVPGIKKTHDMHEIPLHKSDLIWGNMTYEQSGCRAFIEYCAVHGIEMVVEWNKSRHTIQMLREFIDQVTIED